MENNSLAIGNTEKADALSDKKQYLISGWELDLDNLIIYLDPSHLEMLQALGHEEVPENMNLLEYAARFVHVDDHLYLQEHVQYAIEHREDLHYSDRLELRLLNVEGFVLYFIINSWNLRPGMIKGHGQNITDFKSVKGIMNENTAFLKAVIESTSDYFFIVQCNGTLVLFNENFKNIIQSFFSVDILEGDNILSYLPEAIKQQWANIIHDACQGVKQETEMTLELNETYHVEVSANPIFQDGHLSSISFFVKDITAKWRMTAWASLENKVFENVNRNEDVKSIFDILLDGLAMICPSMIGYVTQRKKDEMVLTWLSHPGISENYTNKILEIPIGPTHGACGLAAYSMQEVFHSNIRDFENWDLYRDFTLLYGFQSCYSFPILSKEGAVLGTLGAYFKEVHDITDFELELLQRTVKVASILLEKLSAESEVLLKSKQLEDISNSMPGIVYIAKMDKEGKRKFDYISDRFSEFMNVSKDEAMESYGNVFKGISEENKKKLEVVVNESLIHLTPFECEFSILKEIKPEFHCYVLKAVHKKAEDGTIYTYGSVYDITMQKKAELELKIQKDEMKELIHCLDDVVYLIDENDSFLEAYSKNENLLFLQQQEIVGMHILDVLSEDVVEMYIQAKEELLTKRESDKFKYPFIIKGNNYFFCTRLIKVENTSKVIFTAKNITSEWETIQVNRKLKEILEEATLHGSLGSFEYNIQTEELVWSKSINSILGWSEQLSSNALYRKYQSAMHPDDNKLFVEYLNAAIKQGNDFEFEHRVMHENGEYLWFHSIAKMIRDEDGIPAGVQGIKLDITSRKVSDLILMKKQSLDEAISLLSVHLLSDGEIENSIQKILANIGASTEVNRVYVFRNDPIAEDGVIRTSRIFEWNDGLYAPQIDNEDLKNCSYSDIGFERWKELLQNRESVIGDIEDFPASEKELLSSQDIQSIAVVPIFSGDIWWGFIGLDECGSNRRWSPEVLEFLSSISNLIGSALLRQEEHERVIESKNLYITAFETVAEGMVITDEEGYYVDSNETALKMLGLEKGQKVGLCSMLKANGSKLIHRDGSEMKEEEYPMNKVLNSKQALKNAMMGVRNPIGEINWLSVNASPIYHENTAVTSGFMLTFADVTKQIDREQALENSLVYMNKLKSSLKSKMSNGLEMISKLLELEGNFSSDESSKLMLSNSAFRVKAIALLNEIISRDDQSDEMSVTDFLEALSKQLKHDHHSESRNIQITSHVENISLGIETALPFALISNELLSNAMKHSNVSTKPVDIVMSFKKQGDYILFEVRDNGNGLPIGFNWEKSNTFGFRLIRKMVNQLQGAATFTSENGCKSIITFPA